MDDSVAVVRQRIAAACVRSDRDPSSVRIIAVSKGRTLADIEHIRQQGLTDFGENRLQDGLPKVVALPGLTWHFIGHVQSNKARQIAQNFAYVHSVDRVEIAGKLQGPQILVEVDYTGIEGRAGVSPGGAESLVAALIAAGRIPMGLMAVAPQGDPAAARRCFASLRDLRDGLSSTLGIELPHLSMGMSDDFEIAVEEGSTMVRIGRALFGAR